MRLLREWRKQNMKLTQCFDTFQFGHNSFKPLNLQSLRMKNNDDSKRNIMETMKQNNFF